MTNPAPPPRPDAPWYSTLTSYHWWILLVCILGWTFDTMDQRIFTLARGDAMKALGAGRDPKELDNLGRWATMIFMFGWATGGILFGILGDKWGRAKTMTITILVYAGFTALSGLSRNIPEFMIYRFLTGLGVGGEFSAGVALLAETIPPHARPHALGLMQGLSAVGNLTGAGIAYLVVGVMGKDWRFLFYMGALPALLAVAVRMTLKEPESWVKAKESEGRGEGKKMGSYRDLFGHPKWRKHAIIGAIIAIVGVTGVWGIGFYSPELITRVLADDYANLEPAERGKMIAKAKSVMMMFQDVGAFFSMYGFAVVSARIGRKPAFHLCCVLGFLAIAIVFGFLESPGQIPLFGFILGFGTMGLFGGYAVYFAEIFPTRLRSTGVSFCYNVGRYLAAVIQLLPAMLVRQITAASPDLPELSAYRTAAVVMAGFYAVGIVVMFFAPETMGKPLPEDEEPAAA